VTDISGLIAGLGIGGLALALAAQDTASNLFGSIAIMVDKPFEIGDWVEFDGFAGTVVSVGLRSTKIRVVDQSILSVPNSKLAASIVSNGALRSSRRVAFHISLVYATPPAVVAAFVEGVKTLLSEDPEIEPDSVLVAFEKFAASSLDVFIAYRTNPDYAEMLRVREKINLAILNMAREMDVSMAFPSISLYQERPSKADEEAGYEAD
jgi:MscS family membrane protein